MGRLKNRFMKLSLKWKLVIVPYVFAVPFTAILILIYAGVVQRAYEKETISLHEASTEQISDTLENIFRNAENLTLHFAIEPDTLMLLKKKDGTIPRTAIRLMVTQDYVCDLAFFDNYGKNVYYNSSDASVEIVAQDGSDRPLADFQDKKKITAWEFTGKDSKLLFAHNKTDKISLWRRINNLDTNQLLGCVVLTLNCERIQKDVFAGFNQEEQVWLLDEQNQQILSAGSGLLTREDLENGLDQNHCIKKKGRKYGVISKSLGDSGFQIVRVFGLQSGLLTKSTLFTAGTGILLLSLLLLFPTLLFATNMVVKPLKKLLLSMDAVRKGKLDTKIEFSYQDEIGVLGATFNEMTENIHLLMDQTYELGLKEKEAQLEALQTQINPHFLYNILDTIRWKAIQCQSSEIANIALAIGQMYRIILNNGCSMIPILLEKELIENYLYLQKVRFKERLEYQIEFGDNLEGVIIPKLIIQPFVENAVVHGCKNCYTPVLVKVTAGLTEDGILNIRVVDDGAGIAAEKLEMIHRSLKSEKQDGNLFAVTNVNERLKILYGADYSLEISGAEDEGTVVTIQIKYGKGSKNGTSADR